MEKPWRVTSPADNYEEDFATEAEALEDAEKVIQLFREEAQDEGEWNEEVEFVKIHRLCHIAQVTKRVEEETGEAVEYGMVPVPQTLPPMDAEMAWILGRPNFTLTGIASRLRELGHFIKERSEDEQAAAIYWMLSLYLQHGATWRDEGVKVLARKEAATEPA